MNLYRNDSWQVPIIIKIAEGNLNHINNERCEKWSDVERDGYYVYKDPSTESLNKDVESHFVQLATDILRMKIVPEKYRQHYQINQAYDLLALLFMTITMKVKNRNSFL